MVSPSIEALPNGNSKVDAYHTVTATSIKKETFPAELVKRLLNYPIPASLITCIAVDSSLQGKGLGKIAVISALTALWKASKVMPSFAVIIDPYDKRAEKLYRGYGFESLDEQYLFLPMKTVDEMFSGSITPKTDGTATVKSRKQQAGSLD